MLKTLKDNLDNLDELSLNKNVTKLNNCINLFDLYPLFCINLKKNPERKKFIELQTNNKNITFIEAIYGKEIEKTLLNKYTEKSKKTDFNNTKLNEGEIGCLLSHIKAYKESLEKCNDEYVIIIEDDINLVSYITNDISDYIIQNLKNYDCIQLCLILSQFYKLPNTKNKLLINWGEEVAKNKPYGGIWSTGAYIISKTAREKIINEFDQHILMPADLYIYKKINTAILFPPVVLPNDDLGTEINSNISAHISSKKKIVSHYYNKKLILITVWFGKLPDYLDLFLYSIQNKNYDILFITDQNINKYPNNFKILNMTFEQFNNHLNYKTGFNVKIKNYSKLVDVKPLLGLLFYEFISDYIYWGWTDIDMIMGDIDNCIPKSNNYDVISYGKASFGPLTIFKISITDIYKYLTNYEEILNDEYICKVDEPWWFIDKNYTNDLQIYIDEKTNVKFYGGKNILDYLKNKSVYVISWSNTCTGIDWSIKNNIKHIKSYNISYEIKDNKLYKNNKEIIFAHLTLLKLKNEFLTFINDKLNKLNNLNMLKDYNNLSFNVKFNYNYNNNITNNFEKYNTYDMYNNYVSIEYL
jgi:GR25 family glycosyltransferase involved in LPS biosynthesis